jgi:hypothetical protein
MTVLAGDLPMFPLEFERSITIVVEPAGRRESFVAVTSITSAGILPGRELDPMGALGLVTGSTVGRSLES